jgi:hypothetical protein
MTPIYTGDIAPHSCGYETMALRLAENIKAHREGLYKERGVLNDHVPQWSKPLVIGSDWIALIKWFEACRLNRYTAVRVIKADGLGAGAVGSIEELHRSLFKYNSLKLK